MIRSKLSNIILKSVQNLSARGQFLSADLPGIEISETRDPSLGDYASNFALVASKALGINPKVFAEQLKQECLNLPEAEEIFAGIDVAGPGFLNLRLKPAFMASHLTDVLNRGDSLPNSKAKVALRINVEFVSVNPNGPITVGSGRGAAFGDTLSSVLAAAGHQVHREYYINDGTNSEQMRLFAESVKALAEGQDLPDNGYKGEYVAQIAGSLSGLAGREGAQLEWYRQHSEAQMIERQRSDLAAFGVVFDTWFSEQSLHDSGEVERNMASLAAKGLADEAPYQTVVERKKGAELSASRVVQGVDEDDAEGAGKTLWLRSTKFGDSKDRVLRRKDGRLTYIASDVAYHKDKFNRPPNADKLITVLGPDHHGYIERLHAVVGALLEDMPSSEGGAPLNEADSVIYKSPAERDACRLALEEAKKRLEVVIFQIVRFLKDGSPAPMRKRDGNIYELRDLISELGRAAAPDGSEEEQIRVGRDVSRFFYLMRSHDTHMDFDIDLATKQSDENPVFYAQYAHARICSILRKGEEAGMVSSGSHSFDPALLSDPREMSLIKKICDLPHEVVRCAEDYGVHRLTTYAVELARTFHHFYDGCRVLLPEDQPLTQARLALCRAAALGLKSSLALLGISAPEKMERAAVTATEPEP